MVLNVWDHGIEGMLKVYRVNTTCRINFVQVGSIKIVVTRWRESLVWSTHLFFSVFLFANFGNVESLCLLCIAQSSGICHMVWTTLNYVGAVLLVVEKRLVNWISRPFKFFYSVHLLNQKAPCFFCAMCLKRFWL